MFAFGSTAIIRRAATVTLLCFSGRKSAFKIKQKKNKQQKTERIELLRPSAAFEASGMTTRRIIWALSERRRGERGRCIGIKHESREEMEQMCRNLMRVELQPLQPHTHTHSNVTTTKPLQGERAAEWGGHAQIQHRPDTTVPPRTQASTHTHAKRRTRTCTCTCTHTCATDINRKAQKRQCCSMWGNISEENTFSTTPSTPPPLAPSLPPPLAPHKYTHTHVHTSPSPLSVGLSIT